MPRPGGDRPSAAVAVWIARHGAWTVPRPEPRSPPCSGTPGTASCRSGSCSPGTRSICSAAGSGPRSSARSPRPGRCISVPAPRSRSALSEPCSPWPPWAPAIRPRPAAVAVSPTRSPAWSPNAAGISAAASTSMRSSCGMAVRSASGPHTGHPGQPPGRARDLFLVSVTIVTVTRNKFECLPENQADIGALFALWTAQNISRVGQNAN
jgi:hypothetical protein